MHRLSLRLRLMLGFLLLTLICWGAASIGSWWQTRHNINQLFDTQQMLFAKLLATMNPEQLSHEPLTLPKTKKLLKHHRGEQEDEALAFAVFTADGSMVMNDGDNGKDFLFSHRRDGFTDGKLRGDDDLWRMVWLPTPDKQYVVVVGQEWEYRDDMTRDIVQTNLIPWLIALPIMLLLLLWLVTHELAPLKRIARQLRLRTPDDGTPLVEKRVPNEVKPLLTELNALFSRVSEMLLRERRFTSDAAHELRSPLAALKVQAEVAQLAHDDETVRRHALQNLDLGIDRATRLVDQLLTLSRLDSKADLATESLDLRQLLQQAVIDHYSQAQAVGMEIALEAPPSPIIRNGNALLLSLMMRNLVENALRYGQSGNLVQLSINENGLAVTDNGPGVSKDDLCRLGQRFYRPPGQEKSGSGLGLSIVNRIARLHGMQMRCANRDGGGFAVMLTW
ncbi:quorum sensing histidine kinase QseC [Erwinia sp. PsM31]|uniref:quorum sensing histidine kinase QseC n=1 Tax=Erwinia sp. PsM31 TaxID=3030535 RepID=UPI00263A81F4|nr:quorum sensing histidine kinase QseC [Erwinia sp. PsM31]MDN4626958.1 quorum sensing histidine kinase QseC [Erwinia sp. PsM31]